MDFISTFPLNFFLFFFFEILKQFEMFNLQFIARLLAVCILERGEQKSLECVCMCICKTNVFTRYSRLRESEKGHKVPLSAKSMNDIENKAN